MRAHVLARKILDILARLGALEDAVLIQTIGLLDTRQVTDAFRIVQKGVLEQFCYEAWNKIWIGDVLHTWCGEMVIKEPLRSVALEIESSDSAEIVKGSLAESTDHLSARFHLCPPLFSGELKRGSVSIVPLNDPTANLKLLQRIGFDMREQPFIEKWYWSGDVGFARLSDYGRYQIKRELFWYKLLEAINYAGRGKDILLDWYSGIAVDDIIITIPSGFPNADLAVVSGVFEYYHFGKIYQTEIHLKVKAGNAPQYLAKLLAE